MGINGSYVMRTLPPFSANINDEDPAHRAHVSNG